MLLSIVVPTYNVEEFIANCLESLLDQDIPETTYEILVINDGATDQSAEIATTYAETHRNVKVVHQKNKGLSGARNTGMHLAKGKYTYFIDSDDYIAKNTLGLIVALLEDNQLDILGVKEVETELLNLKDSANLAHLTTDTLQITDGITFIASNNYLNNAWWYFIKTEFLKASGLSFPVGRLVEDANFTAKLLAAAGRIAYIPLDFYRYYMRPNSIMRKTNIDHVKRLVGDYEKNVFEFEGQLKELNTRNHPKMTECLERLKARQESFVFFQLIKSLRYGLHKENVTGMIDRFKEIQVYPLHNFLGKDYNKFVYRILVPLVNRKKSFLLMLRLRNLLK